MSTAYQTSVIQHLQSMQQVGAITSAQCALATRLVRNDARQFDAAQGMRVSEAADLAVQLAKVQK